MKNGDKVIFLGLKNILYNRNGDDMYAGLTPGQIYTIKQSFIIGLYLEEMDGMYLKEHFRVIKDDGSTV